MAQYQPHPDVDADRRTVEAHPQPLFGLGIAAGILGMGLSMWTFALANVITFFPTQGFWASGLFASLYWILTPTSFVLGALTTVRNRRRNSTLPLALLGIAVLVAVLMITGALTGLPAGTLWWLATIIATMPLAIVAFLAFQSIRRPPRILN